MGGWGLVECEGEGFMATGVRARKPARRYEHAYILLNMHACIQTHAYTCIHALIPNMPLIFTHTGAGAARGCALMRRQRTRLQQASRWAVRRRRRRRRW